MIDINYILGNGKSKKPSKDPLRDLFGIKPSHQAKPKNNIVNQDFMKLFIGQGNPRPDRKTKQQKSFLNKTRMGTGKSHLRFMDFDGDGVINGLDCEYKNSKRHMPYLYTWQNPNSNDPEEASDSQYRNQKYGGRSTGMTGTGIYSYKTKEKALKEAEGSNVFKGRKLYSIETKNPKVFTRDDDFRDFNEASKRLNMAKATGDPRAIKEAQMYFKKAGIPVRSDELKDALKETNDEVEQPVNYLMRRKGYDAVVADDDNDQYRYGSVVIGRKGSFNQKLQEPVDENHYWNEKEMKDWSRRIDDTSKRRDIQAALREVRSNKSNDEIEVESYSDRYDNPQKIANINNRARGKLLQEAKEHGLASKNLADGEYPDLATRMSEIAIDKETRANQDFPVERLKDKGAEDEME